MKKLLFFSTILTLLISISQAGILLDLGVGGGIRNLYQTLKLFYSTFSVNINPTKADFDRKNAFFIYGLIGLLLIPNINFKYLSYSTSANLTKWKIKNSKG